MEAQLERDIERVTSAISDTDGEIAVTVTSDAESKQITVLPSQIIYDAIAKRFECELRQLSRVQFRQERSGHSRDRDWT